jgi:hypothetical protein
VFFNVLAEGAVEAAIAPLLLDHCNKRLGVIYGQQGIDYIRKKLSAWQRSANEINPLLVLCDFKDMKSGCLVETKQEWLGAENPFVVFRIAVQTVESWLLADREGIAGFLSVPLSRVPLNPDVIPDGKEFLVNIARKSNSKSVRDSMCPAPASTALVGPLYVAELRRFLQTEWKIDRAVANSESLRRAVSSISRL